MKPEEWKTFGLFAVAMLGISFLDEGIATTIVVITGLVIILNHYSGAALTGSSGGGSGAGQGD